MTRVRQSEWRRRWGIAAVQVFDGQVAASGDDGWGHDGIPTNFSSTGDNLVVGKGASEIYDSFARFTNVTIPAGATITAAHIAVTARLSGSDGSQKTNIHASDEDDPAAPTDRDELAADPRTTASTAWDDVDYTVDLETNSPDIAAVIQEIVDRGGWASGQAMMIIWDDDGSGANVFAQPYSYDHTASKAIKLHVEYTT